MTGIRKRRSIRSRLRRGAAVGATVLVVTPVVAILGVRFVDPPITAVQIERLIQHPNEPRRYDFVPLERISPNLVEAVVASEDTRFYHHHGLDWTEIGHAVEEKMEDGRLRGASTITQQLARNLFLTTNRSVLRKAAEVPLALLLELLLPKRRILELYLNVVEWGPNVFGAQAAAEYHYGVRAAALTREQAARLAAILPAPRKWRPANMNRAARRIQRRMGDTQ